MIIVEAKKDNFEEGWGQCLAELVAAQKINLDQNVKLFGIVSNGKLWEFGLLQNTDFIKNKKYYILEDLELLMAAPKFIFMSSFEQVKLEN